MVNKSEQSSFDQKEKVSKNISFQFWSWICSKGVKQHDVLQVATLTFQNSFASWGCENIPITNLLHSDESLTQQLKDCG